MVNNIASYLPSSMLFNPYGAYGNTGISGAYGSNSIYGMGYGNMYGLGNQDYSYYYLQDQNARNTTQEASMLAGAGTGAAIGAFGCMATGAKIGSVGGVLGIALGAFVGLFAGMAFNKYISK